MQHCCHITSFWMFLKKKFIYLVLCKNVTLQMEGQVEHVASWDTALIYMFSGHQTI